MKAQLRNMSKRVVITDEQQNIIESCIETMKNTNTNRIIAGMGRNSSQVDKLIEKIFDLIDKKENQSVLKANLKDLQEIKEHKDNYKYERNLVIIEDPVELTEIARNFKGGIIYLPKNLQIENKKEENHD